VARPAVELEGAARLRRTLKAAGVSVQDLKAAHREIAERVVTEAQRRAPVRTGRLKASLRPVGTSASAIVRGGARSVPYANPVHWGWRRRNIRANPFVQEAAEDLRDEIYDEYMQAIEKIIATVEGDTT
jgi:hypothetical protein